MDYVVRHKSRDTIYFISNNRGMSPAFFRKQAGVTLLSIGPSDKSKTTAIILHLRLSIDSGHTKALQKLIVDFAILTNSLLMRAQTFPAPKLFPTRAVAFSTPAEIRPATVEK